MENIKVIVLNNNLGIVSQIEEISADLGEPDCKLTKPYLIDGGNLTPWLFEYTLDDNVMIRSDNILTIASPKPTLLEKYQNIIK
jgi:hypothetical protein